MPSKSGPAAPLPTSMNFLNFKKLLSEPFVMQNTTPLQSLYLKKKKSCSYPILSVFFKSNLCIVSHKNSFQLHLIGSGSATMSAISEKTRSNFAIMIVFDFPPLDWPKLITYLLMILLAPGSFFRMSRLNLLGIKIVLINN